MALLIEKGRHAELVEHFAGTVGVNTPSSTGEMLRKLSMTAFFFWQSDN